jgi:hypothetical protein
LQPEINLLVINGFIKQTLEFSHAVATSFL